MSKFKSVHTMEDGAVLQRDEDDHCVPLWNKSQDRKSEKARCGEVGTADDYLPKKGVRYQHESMHPLADIYF